MTRQWNKTAYPGVRSRLHPTRKHKTKPDQYFAIYFQLDGKQKEEGLGWTHEGWTAKKASILLAELKHNHSIGKPPYSLAEKKAMENERREAEDKKQAVTAKKNIPFHEFFKKEYLPNAKETKKPDSLRKEVEHERNWLGPVVGKMAFKDIRLFHLEKVRSNMAKKESSPRSMQYVMRTFAQVWKHAVHKGLVQGESPSKMLRLPKIDNQRERYLTDDECTALLDNLHGRSIQLHDMALLSLDTGMRFSEVTGLKWGHLDMGKGTIRVMNAKGYKARTLYMTPRVKSLFRSYEWGQDDELVFPNRKGKRITQVSAAFGRAVDELGLNKGIADPKLNFSWHGLRHTFASRLIDKGVDLYTVQKTLGHSTPVMTQRYAHLSDKSVEDAINKLATGSEARTGKVVSIHKRE